MKAQRVIRPLLGLLIAVRRSVTRFDSYSRYLAHHHEHHGGEPALDRRAFYLRQQNRKWSGISRCC
jgi:uncharacterized short protein YbdD (DUF466 family)